MKYDSITCESAQQDIALAVYGELADDASHLLEQHLASCDYCRRELDAVQGLHRAMALYPMEEPSPNLLTRTRLRLEESLDAVPRSGWLTRIIDRLFSGVARIHAAPVMASGLLVIGLTTGGFAGFRVGQKAQAAHPQRSAVTTTQPDETSAENTPKVANISSIVQQPNSENVDVAYNRLVPEVAHGSLDDPEIRKLLLLGAQSRLNPDVREDSVGLLAGECKVGHQCDDGPVRNALMVALRYDKAPQVRLKALDGLEPYVSQDTRVRDSVLDALMNDSDPKVRTKAIGLLQPVESDSSVRQVLHKVASGDENPYLRTVSRQVLDGLPEIQ